MESALRQLTGTIEQLQYWNQQLEMQLKRLQDDRGGPARPHRQAQWGRKCADGARSPVGRVQPGAAAERTWGTAHVPAMKL